MLEWLGLLMFAGVFVLLLLGYPVAFTLGGVAVLFSLLGSVLGVFNLALWGTLPLQVFNTMSNYTLLAIPYFIFMGAMLEKSGIAERLLETIGILFGRVRGGLALAVIIVGALLGATTGVVAATVVAMGLISLPIMLRYGYNKELATGVIVASGTLGQIIPPSVVLVVLADQLGISVGDLFVGAFFPGILMTSVFAIHVFVITLIRPELAPALPEEVRNLRGRHLISRVFGAMIPPLFLIIVVLGSIFFGFATPTEAGALGGIGAILLALVNQRLTWTGLRQVCDATLQITSMVVLILIGSTAFSMVFRGLNGEVVMRTFLANLPGGEWGFLAISMLIVFLLGFFIDFFQIAFIIVPLFAPVAQGFGLDMVWYGVILGANLQTSFLTPPFGFALFYLRGIAPESVTTAEIYRGATQFVLLQILVLMTIIRFPAIVTWLPSLAQSN
ncbi:TRAP transporter large permease [Sodalinema gerasimenkoae]|uniref:TRAP transporter large permease n=1 Tax=Sodalinema gerasimenkoae TaxID=2862348 RepID=UPI00135C5E8E|nr:TRAP transporter large permease subunit [Sodalinema gerasimenkoae]